MGPKGSEESTFGSGTKFGLLLENFKKDQKIEQGGPSQTLLGGDGSDRKHNAFVAPEGSEESTFGPGTKFEPLLEKFENDPKIE